MIHVNFDPDKLDPARRAWWDDWLKEAEAATQEVINAWEEWRKKGSTGEFDYKVDKNQKVWAKLKDWLLDNVFHGKCAYCEVSEVRSSYHAEHFRPKGRVTIKVKNKFTVAKTYDEEGLEVKHPGYFWLAFNWSNLIPSCNNCNTARGKRDQFPVRKTCVAVKRLSADEEKALMNPVVKSAVRDGVYYLQPKFLDVLEEPLLLHPYFDDPREHLIFGEDGGVTAREDEAGNISEKGDQSIKVYDLDAERLRIARQETQETAFKDYTDEFKRGRGIPVQKRIEAARLSIADYIEGRRPFSAAVLDYLRITFPNHGL